MNSQSDAPNTILGFADYLKNCTGQSVADDAAGQSKPDERSPEILWREGVASADDIAVALASFHGMPRIAFELVAAGEVVLNELSPRYLRNAYAFPFSDGGVFTVALADPTRLDVIKALQLAFDTPPVLSIA